MKVRINNRPFVVPDDQVLAKVVGARSLSRIAAMWVNGEPVMEEEYQTKVIHDGDRIKVARITAEYDLVYLKYGKLHYGMRSREENGRTTHESEF